MIHARDRPRSCHAHERRRELHNSSVGMPVDDSCQQHEHRREGGDMAQLDHHRWSARCIQDSRNSRRRSSADRLSLWRGRHNTRSLCEQRKAFRSRDFGVNAGSPLHRMRRARRKRCIASNAVASNGAWRAKRPAPVAPASADRTRALSSRGQPRATHIRPMVFCEANHLSSHSSGRGENARSPASELRCHCATCPRISATWCCSRWPLDGGNRACSGSRDDT